MSAYVQLLIKKMANYLMKQLNKKKEQEFLRNKKKLILNEEYFRFYKETVQL